MISIPRAMTTLIQTLLCIWTFLGSAAAGELSQVLVIPWGEGDAQVAHRWYPGGHYGPSDFVVTSFGPTNESGSFLYLLDREQQRIQCFDLATRSLVAASPVPPRSGRMAIRQELEGAIVAVWDGAALFTGSWGGPFVALKRVGPEPALRHLEWRGDQLLIIGHDSSRHLVGASGPDPLQLAWCQDDWPRIDRLGHSGLVLSKGSQELLRIDLNLDLGAVQYLGSIAGKHLVLTEKIVSHAPIDARELLLVLDAGNGSQQVVPVPFLYFTFFPERFRVVGSTLFVWISAPGGLHLLAADARDLADDQLRFPVFPEEPYHYNHHHPATPAAEWAKAATAPITAEGEISRKRIMEIADTFAVLEWTASEANTTGNGREPIYCPHGDHLIRTPEWVTPGPKLSMPYKWGGFTDVETFVAGAPAGKYCGDDYTSRSAPYHVCYGDTYTMGVDCSGFVSRCWGTRDKYSTSTLVSISRPLSSLHELLRGDCLNLAGSHVRLVAESNPSGPVLIVEAGGADWRVGYRSLTFTELNGYVPRRFLWVTEDAHGPQPRATGGRRVPH